MNTWLVCYDIEDDGDRSRVAGILLRHGQRVQRSVFELHLPRDADLLALRAELRDALDPEDRDLRFYRLTAEGLRQSHDLDGEPLPARPVAVIL